MQLIHLNGNLFSAPKFMPLVHCISYDARMGKGIAKEFQYRFNLRNSILSAHREVGGLVAVFRGRFIVNLITKLRYYDKPTEHDLRSSLIALKQFLQYNGITEVAMPEIAAGLDGVDLNRVINLLYEIFWNTPVTIFMYHI